MANEPHISVVIATRNRAESIARTLAHLRDLELNGLSCEILVVDNGSTGRTRAVLEEASAQLPLTYLQEPIPGKSRSLNRALAVARGSLLVFTDDDILPDRGWIRAIHDATRRWPEDSIFAGRILPLFPDGAPGWIRGDDFAYSSVAFGHFGPSQEEGYVSALPLGANLTVRAQALRGLRFDERIGPTDGDYPLGCEDELMLRMRRRGHRFVYVPDALVRHEVRVEQTTVDWLLDRLRRHGRGCARRNFTLRRRALGVPWNVWIRLGLHGGHYALNRLRSDPARFRAGALFFFYVGAWQELRALHRSPEQASGGRTRN